MTLDLAALRALATADLPTVLATLDAEGVDRTTITGYEALTAVEAIDAPDGERVIVRGDDVVLIYVGEFSLPEDLTSEDLVDAVGSEGETLRSRQGRMARLHVVADQGIAWSEDREGVGFIEIFPPTTVEAYRSEIYQDPGEFIR